MEAFLLVVLLKKKEQKKYGPFMKLSSPVHGTDRTQDV